VRLISRLGAFEKEAILAALAEKIDERWPG